MNVFGHWRTANIVLKNHNCSSPPFIGFVYKLGCIAPDIRAKWPKHRIENPAVINRMSKNIDKIKTGKTKLVRSFRAGLLSHYLCDLFCHAHNNPNMMGGKVHSQYESALTRTEKPLKRDSTEFCADSRSVTSNLNFSSHLTRDIIGEILNLHTQYSQSSSDSLMEGDLLYSIGTTLSITELFDRIR